MRPLQPEGGPEVFQDETAMTTLTHAQHSRLEILPDDLLVVGWDFAWQSPSTAGPLIEDPIDHRICRLSPRGKLLNFPSHEALEGVVRRRAQLG